MGNSIDIEISKFDIKFQDQIMIATVFGSVGGFGSRERFN